MDKSLSTPRRPARGRPRGRPRGSVASSRSNRIAASPIPNSEPPLKRRRYVPGGPGGGGRFIDDQGVEVPAPATAPRPRLTSASSTLPTRERSTRIRTAVNREEPEEMQLSSAAAVAAAVVQSEGYKPREERGWEEFHPNLDIEATFMVFNAEDVDGMPQPALAAQTSDTQVNGASTPSNEGAALPTEPTHPSKAQGKPALDGVLFSTPPKRRVGRPPRDPVAFYAAHPNGLTPKTPKVLPIHNQTPKERLDLKQPSYRKTDRILLFESKTFGQARYVDKSMMNVGYQESDNFIRPDRNLIKAGDTNMDEELELSWAPKPDGEAALHSVLNPAGVVGRVEYDMDEQDDMWLEKLNVQRRGAELTPITREIFEITITKIEKEWHALEKRIPKPNPKPPQTHRPRSSSAAAVNGEPQAGEEQDSKCAICDDGDCENTNAIVFCDGCDLAVHQECYGVPFIPEGQWLCRKCQLIGRGIPTCIFCPNTDGAFKQTNSSKWAHLLCAMWIPEVSLGNHTFMEPVMEVEKVPKTRWRLSCYICNQRMGACIQCSNKNCYQAFHVTCARRSRLYLKMKNSQGALAFLDGSMLLKAFCDMHCPPDYAKENQVALSTRQAKRFYKRTMKGRIWADSQASAVQLAATHRHAITEHPPDESQMTGAKVSAVLADNKKKGQPAKPIWKLPSGAPIIPQAVFDAVESSLQRFPVGKRKDFVAEACRYWTLKREARRGAALLKRLQLQMETFSSMELTRRNFASMGPSGKARLTRRIEFAEGLLKDLEQLESLSKEIVQRELDKLEAARMEEDFVDTCYFPIHKELLPVVEKAFALDKNVFKDGLTKLQDKLDERFYTSTLAFAHDFCEVIHVGINAEPRPHNGAPRSEAIDVSPTKQSSYSDTRDRKRLAKRILKAVQQVLQGALKAESDITKKPLDTLLKELDGMMEASLEMRPTITVSNGDVPTEENQDVPMPDAAEEAQIIVADGDAPESAHYAENPDAETVGNIKAEQGADVDVNAMDVDNGAGTAASNIEAHRNSTTGVISHGDSSPSHIPQESQHHTGLKGQRAQNIPNGVESRSPPRSVDGYSNHLAPSQQHQQQHPGPLTPPQSNGSLGRGLAATGDVLSEGGVPWYFAKEDLEVQGTTVLEEENWTGNNAAQRQLSEELSEMDEETLKDLGIDVNDHSITASPVEDTAAAASNGGRKRYDPARFRKGVRSSARRR